jgi:hypothetical protein
MTFEYLLENFPEWAIPMTKVMPVFYTENAYNLDDCTFSVTWNYLWEIVDEINVKLHVHFDLIDFHMHNEEETRIILPLFLDLKLYFVNRNQYNELYQFKK